jgi:D-alanyl-D-alanine carboxypeptidase
MLPKNQKKHNMKKNIFTTFIFILFNASFLNAQIPAAVAARLQNVLDSVCNKYKIKGTSAAVLIPNVGGWEGTNGSSYYGVPVIPNMLMGMGSNTKTHFAALLLKMQEQGFLSLNDTIGNWIKGYPNISGKITIRQCLNHTSGLFDYFKNSAVNDSIFGHPSKIWQPEEILSLAQKPNFTPGSKYDYSNTNYIIVGIIIRKILNKSPYTALKDMLLTPNNLNNTFNFGEEGSIVKANAWSINLTGINLTDMTTTPYQTNLFSLANTAGSLITTAEENVRFWHMLTSGQILNATSWKEMTTMINIGGGASYGLGIFRFSKLVNGRTFYSHGGTFFGYINENMVDTTSKVCISVMTNQDSVNNGGLRNIVIAALHKVTLKMPANISNYNFESNEVSIFPNPANEIIKIDLGKIYPNSHVEIYDITGKLILKEELQEKLSSISTEKIDNGIYFLKITENDSGITLTKKIQIRR